MRLTLAPLALLLAACASKPPPEEKEAPLRGTISLSSGPCRGLCPVYRMTIAPDDTYRLDAGENTIKPGKSRGALPVNSFRRAVEALERHGYADLARFYTQGEPDTCPDYISDLATIDIARIDESDRKIVTFDTGCIGFDERDRLDRLHERLREVMRLRDLVFVGEPPKAAPPPSGPGPE